MSKCPAIFGAPRSCSPCATRANTERASCVPLLLYTSRARLAHAASSNVDGTQLTIRCGASPRGPDASGLPRKVTILPVPARCPTMLLASLSHRLPYPVCWHLAHCNLPLLLVLATHVSQQIAASRTAVQLSFKRVQKVANAYLQYAVTDVELHRRLLAACSQACTQAFESAKIARTAEHSVYCQRP